MKLLWITCGATIGLTTLSLAVGAVPGDRMRVTDDTALYQKLSEIKAPRAARPNFDEDIRRLNNLEPRYRERLPSLASDPRFAGPMKRISGRGYKYSGSR